MLIEFFINQSVNILSEAVYIIYDFFLASLNLHNFHTHIHFFNNFSIQNRVYATLPLR